MIEKINKEKCKELLYNKKFSELADYFVEEYQKIINEMLKIKGINTNKLSINSSLILATNNLECDDLIILIAEIILNAEKGEYERLSELIDLYKTLYSEYEKMLK